MDSELWKTYLQPVVLEAFSLNEFVEVRVRKSVHVAGKDGRVIRRLSWRPSAKLVHFSEKEAYYARECGGQYDNDVTCAFNCEYGLRV